MNNKILCSLCSGDTELFCNIRGKTYYKCCNCKAVFLDSLHYLTPEQEKERYLKHNNNVEDAGYQAFVQPIVNAIKNNFNYDSKGLDFGAGTGSVISKLLHDCGYNIKLYDPFFCNEPELLKATYDYIVCCEVIEHFSQPFKEFKLLKSMLNSNGKLLCMTFIYNDKIDFKNWYYKEDPTHVFFYHRDSLEWIKNNYNFSSLMIDTNFIKFSY